MTIFSNNKNFDFFPVLPLSSLRSPLTNEFNLIGCSMQMPSIKINNEKKIKKKTKSRSKLKLEDDISFYTGLKQYYKVNIKKDILFDYFVENKKNLVILDKQLNEDSRFLNGNHILPVKSSYEFLKRRFILNFQANSTLKTHEIFVKKFTHVLDAVNKKELLSLTITLTNSKKLKKNSYKLHFYSSEDNRLSDVGKIYSFLGIPGCFIHNYSIPVQGFFIPHYHVWGTRIAYLHTQFYYLSKNLINRPYYFMEYMLSTLNNKKIILPINPTNLFKLLLTEFRTIKFFLRYLLVKGIYYSRWKLGRSDLKSLCKLFNFFFSKTKQIYQNLFSYLLNLFLIQQSSIILSLSKIGVGFSTLNLVSLSNMYSFGIINRGYRLNSTLHMISASHFSFENFNTGNLTALFDKKQMSYPTRSLVKRIFHYQFDIANTRYRKFLFSRLLKNDRKRYSYPFSASRRSVKRSGIS